jgi:F-type H+-transporting ATPase subunit gamma
MANLKDLRIRIASVKSTQKITAAMKMVAAAKLRRAQDTAVTARPYAERMDRVLGNVVQSVGETGAAPAMIVGTGSDRVQLIVVVTADRGLCGGFNSNIVRRSRQRIRELEAEGKEVKLLCVGRKGASVLQTDHGAKIIDRIEGIAKPLPTFDGAADIAQKITHLFDDGQFDCCSILYNTFISALTQEVTWQQLIPLPAREDTPTETQGGASALYDYEPTEEEILAALLPRNLAVQIFRALLESNASEHGARMTAMDNATRNAGDMIDDLTLNYNRTRQAVITKELIEIISGAEAV